MNLILDHDLEQRLEELARRQGTSLSTLVVQALRERFLTQQTAPQQADEWESKLALVVSDCGVSLPDDALTSEAIYEP